MKFFPLFPAALALLLAACTPEEEQMPPVFTLSSDKEIVADAQGGEYSLTYTLENPAADGNIKAVSDPEGWIGEWDYSHEGVVSFIVDENVAGEGREAEITVTYTCPTAEPQSFTVKLSQKANEEGQDQEPDPDPDPDPQPEPVLTLTGDTEIETGAKGGDYEITFTLENPVTDGVLSAESDEWIGTTVNLTSVSVHVHENESTEQRSGEVTVKYAWDDGVQSFAVTVRQDGQEEGEKDYSDAFTIEVPENEITTYSARVISSCKYAELTWTSQIMERRQFDEYVGDKSNMESFFMDLLQNQAASHGYATVEDLLVNFLLKGIYTEDYTYGLLSGTEYMTYAVGMNYDAEFTTDFYWGPEFSSKSVGLTDLTFDMDVDVEAGVAAISISPSDKSAPYIVTVVDGELFDAGYADEDIMEEICGKYGPLLSMNALTGDKVINVDGIEPGRQYYALAFGVDLDALTYNSDLTAVPFTSDGF